MKTLIKAALNQVRAEADLKDATIKAFERNRNIYEKKEWDGK